ncbi:NUDIX domain-containing protein [Flavobacterium hauense]
MKQSAGIVLYRKGKKETEFFLVHPGGPFFAKKHEGWWTIPKGELLPDESPLDCAIREFEEETGYKPVSPFTPLQPIIQKGGKQVLAFAAKGDLNPETITSNTFTIEWPPKSGKMREFPEVDKAGWFDLAEAKVLINERQVALLEEVVDLFAF